LSAASAITPQTGIFMALTRLQEKFVTDRPHPALPQDIMLRAPSASSASRRVALSLAGVAAVSPSATPNAIVCATNQLDWYTSVVGESPCRTYERLRQICDGNCACLLSW
jgi:hypothetical protein